MDVCVEQLAAIKAERRQRMLRYNAFMRYQLRHNPTAVSKKFVRAFAELKERAILKKTKGEEYE